MGKKKTLTKEEKKLWLQILKETKTIRSMMPIAHWESSEWFAIWPSVSPEPYFASLFTANNGKGEVIRFFKGWRALSDFAQLQSRKKPPINLWMLEIPMFEIFLTEGELMLPCTGPLLRELNLPIPHAHDPYEEIHRVGPGIHPWNPTREELPIVYSLVHQLFGIFLRLEEKDKLLLPKGPLDVFCRKQQQETGDWEDTFVTVKAYEQPGIEISLNADVLDQIRTLPMTGMHVQLDLCQLFFPLGILMPVQISEGKEIGFSEIPEHPGSIYLLLAVDKKTGKYYHSHVLSAASGIQKLWERVPLLLLNLMQKMGGLPESMDISGTRMENLLRAMMLPQQFRLMNRKELKKIDQIMPEVLTGLVTESL